MFCMSHYSLHIFATLEEVGGELAETTDRTHHVQYIFVVPEALPSDVFLLGSPESFL